MEKDFYSLKEAIDLLKSRNPHTEIKNRTYYLIGTKCADNLTKEGEYKWKLKFEELERKYKKLLKKLNNE